MSATEIQPTKEQAVENVLSQARAAQSGPFGRIFQVYQAFQERREALGLSNPGTTENIAREQTDVFLNRQTFSGLRADLRKTLSGVPIYQVAHSLSIGSQVQQPYSYTAIYGDPRIFMQGTIDTEKLNGTFNWRWTSALVTKIHIQFHTLMNSVQFENSYTGADFSASINAANPSILDGGLTGTFAANYLQAITPKLSLGIDTVWSRPAMAYPPELAVTYAGRYKSADWMACGLIMPDRGVMEASYWRKLTDKVETGLNCNLAFAGIGPGGPMAGMQKEGSVSIGVKYDFRMAMSVFKAQVDNTGKVSCLLQKSIAPPIQLIFAGEIDHRQGAAKIGLAVEIDAADEGVMEAQEAAGLSMGGQVPY